MPAEPLLRSDGHLIQICARRSLSLRPGIATERTGRTVRSQKRGAAIQDEITPLGGNTQGNPAAGSMFRILLPG